MREQSKQHNSDIELLQKLIQSAQGKDPIALLQDIGKVCHALSWNEGDADITRNKYGYISRHKKASGKRNEFNGVHSGIHFETLSALRHFDQNETVLKKLPDNFKSKLADDITIFLKNIQWLLDDKPENFKVTDTLNTTSMLMGDLWIFSSLLNEFRNFNMLNINPSISQRDRYYMARVIVILGESAKMISVHYKPNKHNSEQRVAISEFFHHLGKLRDLIKVKSHYIRDKHIVAIKLHRFFLENIEMIQEILEACLLITKQSIITASAPSLETLNTLATLCLQINIKLSEILKPKAKKTKIAEKTPKQTIEKPIEKRLHSLIQGIFRVTGLLSSQSDPSNNDKKSRKKQGQFSKQLTKLKSDYSKIKQQLDEQEKSRWPDENDEQSLQQFINRHAEEINISTQQQKKQKKEVSVDVERNLEVLQHESTFISSLSRDQSIQSLYAQKQAIGYMGQAYKELSKSEVFREMFAELGYLSWEQGIDKTVWTRHKRIMHDPLSGEPEFFEDVISLEIRPWTKDIANIARIRLLKQLLQSHELLKVHAKEQRQPIVFAKISIHNEIGLIYTRCGKWEQAKKCFQDALSLKTPPLARCPILHNLADVYRHFGQSNEVLNIAQEICSIRQQLGDKEKLASALNDLAVAYSSLNANEKAMDCYRQALAISEDEAKPGLMANMAGHYADSGDFQQALSLYREAKVKALENANWLEYTFISCELLYTCTEASEMQEAESIADEIMSNLRSIKESIRVQHGEQSFLHELRVFQRIAECLVTTGRYQEALNTLEPFVSQAESLLPNFQYQDNLSHFFNSVGYICYKCDKFAEAKTHLERSISLCDFDSKKIMSKQTLGLVYIALKQPQQAKAELIEVIRLAKIHEKKPLEAIASNSLANLIMDQDGATKEAFTLIFRALSLNKEIYQGKDNHEMARILSMLSRYHYHDKKYALAFSRLNQCLDMMVRLFPERNHPEFSNIYADLVLHKFLLGAEDFLSYALSILTEVSVKSNTHAQMNIYRDIISFLVLNNKANESFPYIIEFKKLHNKGNIALEELFSTLALNYLSFSASNIAVKLLKRSISICPKDKGRRLAYYHHQLAHIFLNLGRELSGTSKYKESAPYYTKAKYYFDICLQKYSEFFDNTNALQQNVFTCMACAQMYSSHAKGVKKLFSTLRTAKKDDVQFFTMKDMPNNTQNKF